MIELLSYAGRRVLVFGGGGGGMGAAAVRDLVELGAEVHVVDLREPPLDVASYQSADLRDPAAIDAAVAAVGGPLHSMFYCAGLPGPPFSPVEVMTVNFLSARYATHAAEPLLVEGASVCSISSGAGMGWMMHLPQILELVATSSVDEGRRWCEANAELVDNGYAFSKEVIIVWTMAASVGLGSRNGIRLNCISPGPTDTPMMPQFIANSGKDFFDALPRPLGRNSTPEEQGHVMVFLNSDAASYVTGSNLFTDGAFTAGLYTGQFQLAAPARSQS
jgi:NAD(P)-dependent dehydrogenase (short-subunit alcohol dehydrogenase family)